LKAYKSIEKRFDYGIMGQPLYWGVNTFGKKGAIKKDERVKFIKMDVYAQYCRYTEVYAIGRFKNKF
jgi:hypothetical protein